MSQAQVSGSGPPWWHGAVIYQLYVRSWRDSDVSDYTGVHPELGTLAGLGELITLDRAGPRPARGPRPGTGAPGWAAGGPRDSSADISTRQHRNMVVHGRAM